jgi:hypothetical protein
MRPASATPTSSPQSSPLLKNRSRAVFFSSPGKEPPSRKKGLTPGPPRHGSRRGPNLALGGRAVPLPKVSAATLGRRAWDRPTEADSPNPAPILRRSRLITNQTLGWGGCVPPDRGSASRLHAHVPSPAPVVEGALRRQRRDAGEDHAHEVDAELRERPTELVPAEARQTAELRATTIAPMIRICERGRPSGERAGARRPPASPSPLRARASSARSRSCPGRPGRRRRQGARSCRSPRHRRARGTPPCTSRSAGRESA